MLTCEQCGTAPAVLKLTTIRDSTVTHEDLCPACAETRGVDVRPPSESRPALKDFLLEEKRGGRAPDRADDPPSPVSGPDDR
jgi:protein-arginine kinase activator protein McsA